MWSPTQVLCIVAVTIFANTPLRGFGATASMNAGCADLQFIAVAPVGSSKVKPCNSKIDKSSCQIAEGFSHFDKVQLADGKSAHRIGLAYPSWESNLNYISRLANSPIIREVNALRIRARTMAGRTLKEVCEPNYIYIGGDVIFGVGPAYVSSERFILDDTVTTNLIMAEDAKAPFHIPLAMLTKDNLIAHSYYEIVVAHELAHGIMQDLYGVDEFSKLEKRVVSRDGHFASGITDPTLAWIEGFAEGFEAYLGESNLNEAQLVTPTLDKMMQDVQNRIGDFNSLGWQGYLLTIPGTIARTAKTMWNAADFVSDFLKAERQRPIRNNEYVLQGNFNNLSHQYGLPLAFNQAEADLLVDYTPESADAVYSKEGVVAHFVYTLLKAGLAERAFETILWGKPRDFWEFASELRATLSDAEFARVADSYKTTFTTAGRAAVQSRLKLLIDPDNRHATGMNVGNVEKAYTEKLAKIAVPERLPPPGDFWVEFWNGSVLHQKIYGRLDRINLSTAGPGRIDDFLKTLSLVDGARSSLLANVINTRAELIFTGKIHSVEEFANALRGAHIPHAEAAATQLELMRRCFLSRCLSHELPGEK